MDFQKIWEDDILAYTAFLVLILPIPFIYAFLDSSMYGRGAATLAFYSFFADAVLWFSVSVIYVLYVKWKRSRKVEVEIDRSG